MTKEYDLVILGAGSGGYVAAIRAAQLGMSVALIEAKKLGGTCLHKGCIPTKLFLRTAELYRQISLAKQYGIDLTINNLDFKKTQAKKEQVIKGLENGITGLLEKNNVDIYRGYGRILGPSIFSPLAGTISVEYESGQENSIIVPRYVLIATGSTPQSLPDIICDGQFILNSDQALKMTDLPESILIVGGGVIGIEWASLLVDLGVNVTVIEDKADILMTEDSEIRQEVTRQLAIRGIKFYTNTAINSEAIDIKENQVNLSINVNDENIRLQADKLLISIGRSSNITDIGLQNTQINYESGYIEVNEVYVTKESHIYAIGDCIGGMQLAHVASEEGIIAVEHMANKAPLPLKNEQIPINIYSHPEVSKIGLTEEEARKKYTNIVVEKFSFKGIGKAHVYGETDGFMKIITNKETEDIIGIHIVGPQATELIGEASLAKFLDATAWELSKVIHPHPSLNEIFKETALATEGLQIHQ